MVQLSNFRLFLIGIMLQGMLLPFNIQADALNEQGLFTDQEQRWILQNPKVKFTGDPNWLPYEAFESNGQYIGIVSDHLRMIEQYSGLQFEPIPVSSWTESLEIATQGQVSVISGDAADAILNRQFSPVDSYSHNPIVIIMGVQQNYVEKLDEIKGKRLAIIKDYGYTADIFKAYPDYEFIEVENIQQGLEGVSEQHYDAMLATYALASYHIAEMGIHNIKIVGKTPIIMDLTLFVDKSQPLLYSIINKSLKSISKAQSQDILQSWVRTQYVEKTDYWLIVQITAVLLVVVAFILFWNRRLKSEIGQRQRSELALRDSEQRLDLAMEVANDGIWDWQVKEDKVLYDKRYYTMAGYEPYEFEQNFEEWEKRVHPDYIKVVKNSLQNFLQGHQDEHDVEFKYLRKDGKYMWIRGRGKIVERDENGSPLRVVGTHADISQKKAYEKQLVRVAHFDALTDLPNRVLLADRLNQAMNQVKRRGLHLAVVFIDFDGFKTINDQYGHVVGDQFLMQISSSMNEVLRKGDTISRIGGDEFVAVLGDLDEYNDSHPLLERLLESAAKPLSVDDHQLQVSASLGVTYYPQQDEVNADQLLRQADIAMYQAKLAGKNRFHIFDFERDSDERGRLESLEDIKKALKNEEFILYYQPKVNMRSGEVIGAEALIRWQHPQQGLLLPGAFLPAIDGSAVEIDLGEWVIQTALKQITEWQKQGVYVPLSVNVGAVQLQQPEFIERLKQFLAQQDEIPQGSLELEVLETSALLDIEQVSRVIRECQGLGISFAIDDFGTGYSSLAYFKKLPAAKLKIDRSFVRDMLDDPEDLAILEGVIGIAAAFRRDVIAEGVESQAHGVMLLQLGCELAQGFGIARPMPAHDLPVWMTQWKTYENWNTQQTLSRDDFPILFACVEHRAWIKHLELYLTGDKHQTPPMDHRLCSFGGWLNSFAKTRYKDNEELLTMEPLHKLIHKQSDRLVELKQQGDDELALEGMDNLYKMRNKLISSLNSLTNSLN